MVKNPPANAGDTGDVISVSGSESSPGGGSDNPLQYSCLENPMDRGTWWAAVHRVAKSQTRLSTHAIVTVISFCLPKEWILADSWAQNGVMDASISVLISNAIGINNK